MSSVPYSVRGYTQTNTINPWGDDRSPDWTNHKKRGERLWVNNADDCAMLCDQWYLCKSFTMSNDPGTNGGQSICYLNMEPTAGFTSSMDKSSQWIKNPQNYDKTGSSTVPSTRFTTLDINNENGPSLDTSAKWSCTGRNCCTPSDATTGGTTGYLLQGAKGGGDNNDHCGTYVGSASGACGIPGKVVRTTAPTTSGWKCHYNTIDKQWIIDNWNNINQRFDETNTNNIKDDFCANTISSADITGIHNQKCKTWYKSTSGNNTDTEWYKYLIAKSVNKTGWQSDRSSQQLLVQSCKTGSIDTSNECKNALGKIDTGSSWASNFIDSLNEVTTSTLFSIDLVSIAKQKTEAYCAANQSRPECACRNAIVLGLGRCATGIPGCEELVQYQKLQTTLQALPQTSQTQALLADIRNIKPRSQASACLNAYEGTTSSVLVYDRKGPGDIITMNNCIQDINNWGTIDSNNIEMSCNITNTASPGSSSDNSGKSSSDNSGKSSSDKAGKSSTNTTNWTLIITVIIILILIIGVGGVILLNT